jgi:hypothetical protein
MVDGETNTVKSKYPHVEWIDLKNDGTLVECAIMRKDANGNIYFFEVGNLDNVDKQRLFNIIVDRNASRYELWDLMSQKTLGNGLNALEYFHQLVKVITPAGQVMTPRAGVLGAPNSGRMRMMNEEVTNESPNKRGKKGKKADVAPEEDDMDAE